MAYSRMPYVQTYETKRVEFPTNPLGRSGLLPAKDASLINMMVDVTKGFRQPQVFYRSRAGLAQAYSNTAGTARGIFYWNYQGSSYCMYVIGANVYCNGTLVTTIATSTGRVGFCTYTADTGLISLFMADGTEAYLFSSPTTSPTLINTSTDSNFPSPHLPYPVFLDGYIFLTKAGSIDTYNSDVNGGPTVWTNSTSPNFISAEAYGFPSVALAKNNNYIYAITTGSIEYYYDAGNATGTPLLVQAPAIQQMGCPAGETVAQTEQEVILVGQTGNGGASVYTITGFKVKDIGTSWVRGILVTENYNLPNASAYVTRVSGQKLYVLQLSSRTIVYNFETELWSEWSSGTSGGNRFVGYMGTDGNNGTPYLIDATAGIVYIMSENTYTDNGTPFLCQIITEKQDFGSLDKKTCSRFGLVGDVPDSSLINNTFYISWSDDDYNTWSTPRTLSYNVDFPVITQLGAFRRRAFKIAYSMSYPVRLEGYEVNIDKGSR